MSGNMLYFDLQTWDHYLFIRIVVFCCYARANDLVFLSEAGVVLPLIGLDLTT